MLRPIIRHRGLVVFTAAAVGVGIFVKRRANAMKSNELAQKNSNAPNFYVSVDRSGGGI